MPIWEILLRGGMLVLFVTSGIAAFIAGVGTRGGASCDISPLVHPGSLSAVDKCCTQDAPQPVLRFNAFAIALLLLLVYAAHAALIGRHTNTLRQTLKRIYYKRFLEVCAKAQPAEEARVSNTVREKTELERLQETMQSSPKKGNNFFQPVGDDIRKVYLDAAHAFGAHVRHTNERCTLANRPCVAAGFLLASALGVLAWIAVVLNEFAREGSDWRKNNFRCDARACLDSTLNNGTLADVSCFVERESWSELALYAVGSVLGWTGLALLAWTVCKSRARLDKFAESMELALPRSKIAFATHNDKTEQDHACTDAQYDKLASESRAELLQRTADLDTTRRLLVDDEGAGFAEFVSVVAHTMVLIRVVLPWVTSANGTLYDEGVNDDTRFLDDEARLQLPDFLRTRANNFGKPPKTIARMAMVANVLRRAKKSFLVPFSVVFHGHENYFFESDCLLDATGSWIHAVMTELKWVLLCKVLSKEQASASKNQTAVADSAEYVLANSRKTHAYSANGARLAEEGGFSDLVYWGRPALPAKQGRAAEAKV